MYFERYKSNTRPYGVLLFLVLMGAYLFWPDSCYACGTPGKNGPATLSGIVNTYYPGTANAGVGATQITLGASKGSGITLQPGDFVLIIQMQDASMNSSNSDAYGDGVGGDIHPNTKPNPAVIPGPNAASGSTSLNNTGLYEYNVAQSAVGATGGTLTLAKPLVNAYGDDIKTNTSGQKRFQVVRVPQYSSATISSPVTAYSWDGNVGGIVVFDVAGNLNFNGQTIDVSKQGFRGGLGIAVKLDDTLTFVYADENENSGYKGEGIAGSPTRMWDGVTNITTITGGVSGSGYPGGNRGMGAPGNAGGGGGYDSGGGGGANAGAGGRGGDEYCPSNPQYTPIVNICKFLAEKPGKEDHTPGPLGGLGGFVASGMLQKTRMIMGGGGGGGADHESIDDFNDKKVPSLILKGGGRGGGIVILRIGAHTGTGIINASGQNASIPGSPKANGSGGGGGGTIYIASSSSLSGLTLTVNGGGGGFVTNHGPGGGGGGGVVYESGGATVSSFELSGGPAGKRSLKEPSGELNATEGKSGVSQNVDPNNMLPGGGGAACLPELTVQKITTTPTLSGTNLKASYTLTLSNAVGKGTATGVNIIDDLPTPLTYDSSTPVIPTYAGGASGPASLTGSGSDPVTFGTAGGSPSFNLPGGGSVTLSFLALINSGTGLFQNPANTSFLDPTRTTASQTATPKGTYASGVPVGGSNYDSSSSTGEDVLVGSVELTLTKSVMTVSDPVNGITNPKAISGAFVDYTLTMASPSSADVTGVFLTDSVPPQAELFVGDIGTFGSGPVLFTDGSPTSGLTCSFTSLSNTADCLEFSKDGGQTFTYTPSPGAFMVDSQVTNIRIKPQGTFAKNTNATFKFRVRIK